MIETSFSWILWVAIVLIQAIIHFGVIEPRSRKRKEEKQRSLETIILESIPKAPSAGGREIRTRSNPGQDETSMSCSSQARENCIFSQSSLDSEESSSEHDPDETDTRESHKMEQQHSSHSTNRKSTRHQGGDKKSTMITGPLRELNGIDSNQNSSLGQSERYYRTIGSNERENEDSSVKDLHDRFERSGSRESNSCKFLQDKICENRYGSYDDDEDSYSNEDDEWRNSLVQYYYSPASPSLIKIASQRAISFYDDMEEEEDPAMQIVDHSTSISSKPIGSCYSARSMESPSPLQKGVLKNASSNANCAVLEEREGKVSSARTKHVLFADEMASKSHFISILSPMVCT